jgi:hypothetical protein
VAKARTWWIFSSEKPTENWPGTELFGPYTLDEALTAFELMGGSKAQFTYQREETIRAALKETHHTVDQVIWNRVEGR